MTDAPRHPRGTPALTNTAIEALPPGAELRDDKVPGLSVRAHASGRSFMLAYRTRFGVRRRPKLGDWGVLGLAQAREIARAMLVRVAAGEDPVAERARTKLEPDMDGLWARCEAEHWNRERAWDRLAKQLYKRHVGPRLGGSKVSAVGYEDAAKVRDALKATPMQANRTIAVLSKMLKLAEVWKMRPLNSNPCGHVRRYRETSRRRFATPAEIARLGPILEREAAAHPAGAAFLYLLLFSGARPSEIERAAPGQVQPLEGGGAVLRIAEGKTGVRNVFLPPQAVAVLERLPKARTTLAGCPMPRALWERVRTKAGCPDLWARDFRRTFATVGLSYGLVNKDQIGELLGHASTQTTSIYAKLIEDPALAAASAIADRMGALLGASDGTAETDRGAGRVAAVHALAGRQLADLVKAEKTPAAETAGVFG